MGFSRLSSVARLAVLFAAGGGAALAVGRGWYATMTLALLVGLWTGIVAARAAERAGSPSPPAPPPSLPDAATERRLVATLDLSPAPLMTLDPADRLRALNRAARRLLGAEDLVSDPPPGLVGTIVATPPGRSATVTIGGGPDERTFALITTDLTGPTPARIAALVDIGAELKAAEAAALRELLRVLNHEITNTLTPIASLAHSAAAMLAEPGANLSEARDAVETVARRADGLQRFSADYAALSHLPPPVPGTVEVVQFTDDLRRLFVERWPDLLFVLETGAAPATLTADADQLHAAIWALLQNGAEAGGAEVRLTVSAVVEGTLIEVADDGGGIAAADRDSILQPFFTTKPNGSGIGLPLSRQILRAHGGDLFVPAPAGGRGASFSALLPHRRG